METTFFVVVVSTAAFIRRSWLPYGLPGSWCGGGKDSNYLFIGNQKGMLKDADVSLAPTLLTPVRVLPGTWSVGLENGLTVTTLQMQRDDRSHASACDSRGTRMWALGHRYSTFCCHPGEFGAHWKIVVTGCLQGSHMQKSWSSLYIIWNNLDWAPCIQSQIENPQMVYIFLPLALIKQLPPRNLPDKT